MGEKDIPKRVYLDTSYLIPIIKKRVTDKSDEKSSIVERSMYRARDKYKIIIPQIVVGELFGEASRVDEKSNGRSSSARSS
jgi:rRNA-processing protein FCF1